MNLARWLLARLVSDEWRESILGDLDEEQQRRRSRGQRAGSLWLSVAIVITTIKLAYASRRRMDQHSGALMRRMHTSIEQWTVDGRQAVRSLASTPGFTLVALIVLTLGIGASTAIFSLVDAVVLRDLPFDQPDRLLVVGEVDPTGPKLVAESAAYPNYAAWRDEQRSFQQLAASASARGFTIRGDGEPEVLTATRATANLFDVLRIRPQLGRLFTAANEVEGAHRVALISDALWRRRFGSDPLVVGRSLDVDAGRYEIIGVMPAGFGYPGVTRGTDVWVPYYVFELNDKVRTRGRNYYLRVVGRLKDDVTLDQARADIAVITNRLAKEFPRWFEDRAALVQPLHDTIVGRVRAWMLMLLGAVGLVLLIACVNVANLLVARGATRSREMTVRAALGASRWQMARTLLVESLMLSLVGTACALLLATWGVALLQDTLPTGLPRVATVAINLRVLSLAALCAIITGVIFGIVPALQASRPNLVNALRDGGRSSTMGRERLRTHSALVIGQVALALVMLIGAGLFLSSFVKLMRVNLGFDPQHVLTAGVNPWPGVVVTDESLERVRQRTQPAVAEVIQRVRQMPGITAVAAVSGGAPLSGAFRTNTVTVAGRPPLTSADDEAEIREVTPEYAAALRVPIRRGRFISDDDRAGAAPVIVLSDEAVARYFGGADPIGTTVTIDEQPRLVVGVVGDVRTKGPDSRQQPQVYVPFAQAQPLGATLVLRTTGDAMAAAPAVKAAVLASLPGVPVAGLTSLETSLNTALAQRRFNTMIIGLFGVLAIAIATAGIYGVMAMLVTQRTQEIGVRMALGALPSRVVRMVLGRATSYLVIGVALGWLAAWPLAQTVGAFLFGVTPHDPVVFIGVSGILIAAGLLAATMPARRAARVDPLIALRSE